MFSETMAQRRGGGSVLRGHEHVLTSAAGQKEAVLPCQRHLFGRRREDVYHSMCSRARLNSCEDRDRNN